VLPGDVVTMGDGKLPDFSERLWPRKKILRSESGAGQAHDENRIRESVT
jgi:hypothetical protein